MSSQINLKQLERRAFKATFQDGLWDIFLGLLLLQMAFGPFLYRLGWSPIWILIVMTLFVSIVLLTFSAAKKHIIAPRLGLVQLVTGPQ